MSMTDLAARLADPILERRQEGQGMVEYGLIIALVAVIAIAGLIILGPQVANMFTSVGSSV
jgi:pilus assembly protein Flp/PilA